MSKLKPCPFCGGEAEVHKRKSCIRYYAHKKEHIPKNGILQKEIKYPDGEILYEYMKKQVGVWCLDTACIGRVQKVFDSEEEAIEAWNRRV